MCMIGNEVGKRRYVPRSRAIIAYRAWATTGGWSNGRWAISGLTALWLDYRPNPWRVEKPFATADYRPIARRVYEYGTRVGGNDCGLWAYKSLARSRRNNRNSIRGTVRLWGWVVEHEQGYRAQFAEIVSFVKPPARTMQEVYYPEVRKELLPNPLRATYDQIVKLYFPKGTKVPRMRPPRRSKRVARAR